MTSKPDTVLTTMTPFRTGACESSGILLQNKGIEIAMISLTMRAKQPKEALWLVKTDILRCIIFLEPIRLQSHTQEITCQERRLALNYEIRDMEECVSSLSFKFKWTNKYTIYSRCDGCIDEDTGKLEGT